MKKSSKNLIVVFMLIAVLAVNFASPAAPAQAASPGRDVINAWNQITIRTVVAMGGQPPPAAFVYGAYVQAAVYNAVVAIEGGYAPYKSDIAPQPGASVEAAVATAAYQVLVNYFTSDAQVMALTADYSASLAAIPDGQAKDAGIAIGAEAAAEIIEERANDGRNADIGFSMPAPGPGVWQLPAGVNPQTPWMSQLKPFMLVSPDQFRPGPPPDLGSSEWARQYNEVLLYGRNTSQARTAEQTEIARFWTAHPFTHYNTAFQQLAVSRGLSTVETARLLVMGNMVSADALIGCWDAKYHYLFWRPQAAIAQGESDGNGQTTGDPGFLPLIPTPPHPEYPSGHGCLTSAVAEVLVKVLGTQRIEFDIPSFVANTQPRHYTMANELIQEIIDARVWSGIHYQVSDLTGVNLGRKVAHWTIKRYFLPER
jgi:hypothetical protein